MRTDNVTINRSFPQEILNPAVVHQVGRSRRHWAGLISRSAQASTELRSADGAPIGASWQAQNLETIQLLRIESETDYLKGPARDEDAFYQFILPIQGRVRVAQDSRTAVIGPGHLAVLDTTRSFEVRFDGRVAVVAVGMPQQH